MLVYVSLHDTVLNTIPDRLSKSQMELQDLEALNAAPQIKLGDHLQNVECSIYFLSCYELVNPD